ncbi:Hsp20/alpha crystallin family protein [Paenibacillus humicola]|uniref:Hsp20/alpha crystallin family protein n=1 Tax=Paenibacillus humicola TaxID=3110540 RepID=UPI00237BE5BC|nr:Hsp20/alpha crystallin family protein [Paenibacillus humicola]
MNDNPNPLFDWGKFIRSFTGEESLFSSLHDDGKVDAYVEQIGETVRTAMSKAFPVREPAVKTASVFESHRSVFIRWKVPKDADAYAIRIHVNSRRVRLSNIKGHPDFSVPLPVPVTTKGSRAGIRGGILEIRLPKSFRRLKEKEIFIRDL